MWLYLFVLFVHILFNILYVWGASFGIQKAWFWVHETSFFSLSDGPTAPGSAIHHFFAYACFILWMLVRHSVVICHLTTLIARWACICNKPSLLQIMSLMNLTSLVLGGHIEREVKMTLLTGNSSCCLSTRILLTLNGSDSLILCLIVLDNKKSPKILTEIILQFLKPNCKDKLMFIFQQLNHFCKYLYFGSLPQPRISKIFGYG